jgi:Methyltransferase domain
MLTLRRAYRRIRLRLPQPWSALLGRLVYLPRLASGHEETQRGFAEEALIERLAGESTPLAGIGAGLSERVVEVPWAFRRLSSAAPSRILDVGTAFSPIVYQRLLVRLPQTVELVDLADAWVPGLRTHRADVRALPFADDSYDAAVCISTLEHIGMDNAAYQVASGGGGDVAALRELGRVARTVLVTVPGGSDHDFGWQRQYSPQTFRAIATAAGLAVTRLETFAHDPGRGWSPVDERAVTSRSYGEGSVNAAAVLCAELTRG